MKIILRLDATSQLGMGHLYRCLALANSFRLKGAFCRFIGRFEVPNIEQLIRNLGHDFYNFVDIPSVNALKFQASDGTHNWELDACTMLTAIGKEKVDLCIVDHYDLDERWELVAKEFSDTLMVIDDLANRKHSCDLLLDQNLGRSSIDYDNLLGASVTRLIGPEFSLLRPEFNRLRKASIERRKSGTFKKILVSLGGADFENCTSLVLLSLSKCELPVDTEINVVLGYASPWKDQLLDIVSKIKFKVNILVGISEMAQMMLESDLAIGGAGIMAWERCAMGLPSIIIPIADNQMLGARALHNNQAAVLITSPAELSDVIPTLVPEFMTLLSRSAAKVTDGNGVERVYDALVG